MQRYWGAVAVLNAALVSLIAQQAQVPVFRAGVDYVRVDVVVTDKDDLPIRDLKKEDFTIVEHGRSQFIDDFQFVTIPVEHHRVSASASEPAPDIASNRPASPLSRLFVMVIDDLHILEQDLIHTKEVMTAFINALSPADEVAVVFVGHSNLSQNFTSDRTRLLKTVENVRAALGFGLDALGRSTASNIVNDAKSICAAARSADWVLKNVATSIAGSGHLRRAIIYVSAGSVIPPTPDQNCDFEDLLDIYDAARRADAPIYTIDPRGQVTPEEAIRGAIGAIGNIGNTSGEQYRGLIVTNIGHQQDRLAESAINTGGRHFINQSDLARAVDEIISDNSSFYLLGYYPNPFTADGKFHDLTVRVNRPDARVRSRQGYLSSTVKDESGDPQATLDTAMSSGVNVAGIPLRVFAAPIALAGKGMATVVTVEVTYPGRPPDARQIDDELRLSVMALDPDGRTKASAEKALHFRGVAPDGRPVMFLVNTTIDLPSEPLTLRIGVGSRALGKSGTVQMSVEARRASDKLLLSGVALGFADRPREAVLQGDAIKDFVPFQPTTTRVFAATDKVRVFARTFWGAKDPTVTVALSVIGAPSVATQNLTLAGSRAPNGRWQAALDAVLSLPILSGKYTLQIDVKTPGGQVARQTIPFEIQ